MVAPKETAALEALKNVQALDARALDARIDAEVGRPMLGVFKALARASHAGADEDQVARQVHLMVLAYLMRGEVEGGKR